MGDAPKPGGLGTFGKYDMDKLKFTYEGGKLKVMYIEGDESKKVEKNEWQSAGDSLDVKLQQL
jgi:hypothetical protein